VLIQAIKTIMMSIIILNVVMLSFVAPSWRTPKNASVFSEVKKRVSFCSTNWPQHQSCFDTFKASFTRAISHIKFESEFSKCAPVVLCWST
jgi:hypothetical protein